MHKILHLPDAEYVDTPIWLTDSKEGFTAFINDPNIRFFKRYRTNKVEMYSWTSVRPDILPLGGQIEKHYLEVIEVPDV